MLVVACSSDRTSEAPDSAAPSVQATPPDPAAELDLEFQRVRSRLNAEAAELATLDRSSREYAARYDTFLREAAAAESLRVRRDSVRRAANSPARPTGTS